jgi:hypothetical protein
MTVSVFNLTQQISHQWLNQRVRLICLVFHKLNVKFCCYRHKTLELDLSNS